MLVAISIRGAIVRAVHLLDLINRHSNEHKSILREILGHLKEKISKIEAFKPKTLLRFAVVMETSVLPVSPMTTENVILEVLVHQFSISFFLNGLEFNAESIF